MVTGLFSRYAKRKVTRGFTLVEVIITVAILAFGLVTIYEALFVSVNTYGYYTHFLQTQDWINQKLWETQEELIESLVLSEEQTAGEIVRGHKSYQWVQTVHAVDPEQSLYKVIIKLSWNEGDKRPSIEREAYLLPYALREYNEEGSV